MTEDKLYFEKEIYSKKEYKFSENYDEEIIEDILKLKKSGYVLDIGCGDGSNSLKLSKLGFNVNCIDISKKAIQNIKNKSKQINAVCTDIEEFKLNKKYDIILLLGITHFINKNKLNEIINNLKIHTNNSGIHIIDSFESNLKEKYLDFKILKEETYKDDENNEMFYLITQK